MKKGILSALVLTMALAQTAVGVNAHYDSTLKNSTIKTVSKEQKVTVEEAKKLMDAAKEALDAKREESEKLAADKQAKFNEMQNAEIKASKANDAKDVAKKAYDEALATQKKYTELAVELDKQLTESKNKYDTALKDRDQARKDLDLAQGSLEFANQTGLPKATEEFNAASREFIKLEEAHDAQQNIADNKMKTYYSNCDRIAELEDKRDNNPSEITYAELTELVNLQNGLAGVKEAWDNAQAEADNTLQNKNTAYERKTTAESKLNEMKAKVSELEEQVKSLTAKDSELTESIKTNSTNIKDLTAKKAENAKNVEEANKKVSDLLKPMQDAEEAASKANDAKVAAQKAYDGALKAEKDALAALPALEEAYNNAKATYDKLVAEQDKPVKPETKPENKPAKKPVSTWDDGGPFTTNAEGDVFDRWGNLIYDAPAKVHSSNGYTMVNTSDR